MVDPNGLQDFFHTFSMASYHKWDVKNDFAYVLQFFSLISDGLLGWCVYSLAPLFRYYILNYFRTKTQQDGNPMKPTMIVGFEAFLHIFVLVRLQR